jgi:hypothetical protein
MRLTVFLLGVALLQSGCGRPNDEVPDEDIDLLVPQRGRYEVVEFEFLDWPCLNGQDDAPRNEIYIKDVHVRVVDRRLFLTWGPQWIDENGVDDWVFGGIRCPTDADRNITCETAVHEGIYSNMTSNTSGTFSRTRDSMELIEERYLDCFGNCAKDQCTWTERVVVDWVEAP